MLKKTCSTQRYNKNRSTMIQKETKSPLRNDSKTLQGTCVIVTEEEWDAPTKRKNKKRDQLRK